MGNTIDENIQLAINELVSEFRQYPEKFLTEDDVRAYLYHLLMGYFNKPTRTYDGETSIPVHCEVRWYGSNAKKLKWRSDIVIFDVSSLRTKDTVSFKLPSKAFFFNKPEAIIEIKLRRKIGSSDNKFREDIENDRNKLLNLTDNGDSFFSYLIVFDKKGKTQLPVSSLNNHREYYVYPYNDTSNNSYTGEVV